MSTKEFYNKKARFDYQIEEDIEAGVALEGTEVKAIRAGKLNITGSYARILGGELYWVGANIASPDVDNNRSKKLLLHKSELSKIVGRLEQKNYTLVPLKGYFKRGKFKLLLGLGKGKKAHDKRETIKKRDAEKELAYKAKHYTQKF